MTLIDFKTRSKKPEPSVEVFVNTYGGKSRVTIDVTPLFESAEMEIDIFTHSAEDDEFDETD